MKVLLVDYLNTIIRSLAVNKDLYYKDDNDYINTGGVYGFIRQLSYHINNIDPDLIIVCKDSRPYLRENDFGKYKADRKKDEKNDTFFKNLGINCKLVNDFLKLINIPLWGIEGLEADDLIAKAVLDLNEDVETIYILCNDDDLNQLLVHDNVKILKKKIVYGKKEFCKEFSGITPKEWVYITSLSGTHNNVPGITRVGIKTAIKIFKNPKKYEELLNKNKDLIEKNRQLILLPYPLYRGDFDTPIQEPKINERELIKWLARYDIVYTSFMEDAFCRYS